MSGVTTLPKFRGPCEPGDRAIDMGGRSAGGKLETLGFDFMPRDEIMIRTLYVRSDDADCCTESFRSGMPITVIGIDASDARTECTGAVTSLEYAPMPTEHDGRQWRVTIRA